MTQETYSVYQITNLINDKKYIGITSQAPERRWNNGNGYKYNKHFSNSINKYGWKNFKKEVVNKNLSRDTALLYEAYLISLNNTTNPKQGYNTSLFSSSLGSGSNKYRIVNSEIKTKISDSRTGSKLNTKRYKHLVETHRGVHSAREIYKFNKNNILLDTYPSICEAARKNNLTKQNISQAALGKQYSAGGYIWRFKDSITL